MYFFLRLHPWVEGVISRRRRRFLPTNGFFIKYKRTQIKSNSKLLEKFNLKYTIIIDEINSLDDSQTKETKHRIHLLEV